MVAAPILRLKQGTTLALDVFLSDDLGGAIALGALTANVVVCDALGTLVATLPVAPSAETGWGTISSATAAWPIGTVNAELQVVNGTLTTISDTFQIIVERAVSQ